MVIMFVKASAVLMIDCGVCFLCQMVIAVPSCIVLFLAAPMYALPGVWMGLTVIMTLRMFAGFLRYEICWKPVRRYSLVFQTFERMCKVNWCLSAIRMPWVEVWAGAATFRGLKGYPYVLMATSGEMFWFHESPGLELVKWLSAIFLQDWFVHRSLEIFPSRQWPEIARPWRKAFNMTWANSRCPSSEWHEMLFGGTWESLHLYKPKIRAWFWLWFWLHCPISHPL